MESTDLIWPQLTAVVPGTVRFRARNAAVEAGPANPAFWYNSAAGVDGESLAYMTLTSPEPDAQEKRWELCIIEAGNGATVAHRV